MISEQQGTGVAYATYALCIEDKEFYLWTTSTDLSRVTQNGNN